MSRHRKHRRPRAARPQPAPPAVRDMGGYEATRYTTARQMPLWPSLNPREEVDSWDRDRLWRYARSLYANTAEAHMVVDAAVTLTGWLMPLPTSGDSAWDELALRTFLARVNDPGSFEGSGRLSWREAQLWTERRAVIDGDCLTVLQRGRDGGGMVRLYAAPQLAGDGDGYYAGCKLDHAARITDYRLVSWADGREASAVTVPARSAILYQHHPDPASPRGVSELATAITHAHDLAELNGYHKASAKISASLALVEVKDKDDRRAGQGAWVKGKATAKPDTEQPLIVDGNKVVSLAPGRKLDIIHDTRPSVEVREFCHDLVRAIAWAMGLDPEIVYYLAQMGSAGARLSLQKTREWIAGRLLARESWCTRVYRHIIACEMQAGRLPAPQGDWTRVRWVPRRDLTIDVGREGALAINLIREGLADADAWTLSTTGLPVEYILRNRARNLKLAREIAAEAGVSLAELLPGLAPPGGLSAASPPNPDPLDDVPASGGKAA